MRRVITLSTLPVLCFACAGPTVPRTPEIGRASSSSTLCAAGTPIRIEQLARSPAVMGTSLVTHLSSVSYVPAASSCRIVPVAFNPNSDVLKLEGGGLVAPLGSVFGEPMIRSSLSRQTSAGFFDPGYFPNQIGSCEKRQGDLSVSALPSRAACLHLRLSGSRYVLEAIGADRRAFATVTVRPQSGVTYRGFTSGEFLHGIGGEVALFGNNRSQSVAYVTTFRFLLPQAATNR